MATFRALIGRDLILAVVFLTPTFSVFSGEYRVESPNKELSITVYVDATISFSVDYKNHQVLEATRITMTMAGREVLGDLPKVMSHEMALTNEQITVPVPHKDARITNNFNGLKITFGNDYKVIFRAFDDGIAYQFQDFDSETVAVLNEEMHLTFPDMTSAYFPQEESMYSHNERLYLTKKLSEIGAGDFASLPVMFETPKAKILFTEASLHNYPGMFLSKTDKYSFAAKFPKYVLETQPQKGGWLPDRNEIITVEADHIANVSGARDYPWRLFIISDDDRTFVESNLVTQLSNRSKIPDASWIKPGLVAWDWYNANNIYGVDFEAGLNQATYEYYIDFASKNGIEYVILDVGWSKSETDVLEENDDMDVPTLIQYAKSKNVGIILWILWKPLDQAPEEILQLYSHWGAAGIKVDYMQRSDQYMVHSYEKIAEIAARHKLLVNYHGAFKPAGIERVWPNVLNYEAVQGNEQNKWSTNITPEHNVTIPFIRMAAGPLDYTPGSMTNMNQADYETGDTKFAAFFTRPMSFGTRTHQVAMYVVYEAPLQMLSDSPTLYYKEQETVDLITQIPTVWDETVVLEGAVSDYIVVARRNGEHWYIGAMTDWTSRDFDLDLSFLEAGEYQMQSMRDGVNAGRNAQDYKTAIRQVNKDSRVRIKLASGGGWVAVLKKAQLDHP